MWQARERAYPTLFAHRKGFRLCGGDQGAFRSPPGPLRGPSLAALGETSHKKQTSLRQGKGNGPILTFPASQRIRLCGGDQRAFRSPFGNLRAPCCAWDLPQEIDFLRKARERAYLLFFVSQRVSPQRRRPKGFPVALWKPSGPLLRTGLATRNRFLAQGKEPSIFFRITEGFASAEATRGLSGRPLDPFGGLYSLQMGEICHKQQSLCGRQGKCLSCFFLHVQNRS